MVRRHGSILDLTWIYFLWAVFVACSSIDFFNKRAIVLVWVTLEADSKTEIQDTLFGKGSRKCCQGAWW